MSQEHGKTEAGNAVHLTAEEAEAVARGAVGDVALQSARTSGMHGDTKQNALSNMEHVELHAETGGVPPQMADEVTRKDGQDFDAVLASFIGSVKKDLPTRSM